MNGILKNLQGKIISEGIIISVSKLIYNNDYPVNSANVKVDEETQAFSNLGNN